jgi:hypothetical protein
MATKIETDLTPEALLEFFQRLARTKGGITGPAIKALCAEFGVTISHETANQYRTGIIARELERLRRNAEQSRQLVDLVKENVPVGAANAVRLQMAISDKLDELPADASADDLATLATANEKMLASARNEKRLASDLQVATKRIEVADKQLALRDEQIQRLQREKTEWEELRAKTKAALENVKNVKGGLSKEALKRIEEAAAIL